LVYKVIGLYLGWADEELDENRRHVWDGFARNDFVAVGAQCRQAEQPRLH